MIAKANELPGTVGLLVTRHHLSLLVATIHREHLLLIVRVVLGLDLRTPQGFQLIPDRNLTAKALQFLLLSLESLSQNGDLLLLELYPGLQRLDFYFLLIPFISTSSFFLVNFCSELIELVVPVVKPLLQIVDLLIFVGDCLVAEILLTLLLLPHFFQYALLRFHLFL